ncbi:MAG: 2-oxoacid:acceptor oxidoreductase family protein [Patescibacteria group bacterium]|nr:2-oxoacid:acceptor oxidoreductase family protein [Patescibacteria group bacterium]
MQHDDKEVQVNSAFNIIVAGYGGQGVLTLAEILAYAVVAEGYEVRQAELHGLAQRGGSLATHVRLGKSVYSPLVSKGGADLIIALEFGEAARVALEYGSNQTFLLANSKFFSPAQGRNKSSVDLIQAEESLTEQLKGMEVVDADKKVRALTGDIFSVNIYMLARALGMSLLPLKRESVWQVIENKLRGKYLDLNRKVFEVAVQD